MANGAQQTTARSPPSRRGKVDTIPPPVRNLGTVRDDLQRRMGNRGLQRMLQAKSKLTINAPGDVHEQEADRVAEQVMRMPVLELQRACACDGQYPACGTAQGVHQHVQTTRMETSDLAGADVSPIVHEALRSSGQPLDAATRTFMEPRFGYHFTEVRIHTGARADQASRDIHARAFTVGRDIVFRQGEYDPGSSKGRLLLAHELTHTLQQNGVTEADQIQRQPLPHETKSPGLDPTSNPAKGATDRAKRQGEEAAKALAPPKLSKKTVAGAVGSECGGFDWTVQWQLDKKTTKGGWVVQKVELLFDVKDCANKAVDSEKAGGLQASWYPLWEAWQINKNQQVTRYAETGDTADDRYAARGLGNSKGTVIVKGTAEFYDGLTLPSNFKVTNKPPTGVLPGTKSSPSLAGGTGSISHDLKAAWDCCSKDKAASRQTKVTAT